MADILNILNSLLISEGKNVWESEGSAEVAIEGQVGGQEGHHPAKCIT